MGRRSDQRETTREIYSIYCAIQTNYQTSQDSACEIIFRQSEQNVRGRGPLLPSVPSLATHTLLLLLLSMALLARHARWLVSETVSAPTPIASTASIERKMLRKQISWSGKAHSTDRMTLRVLIAWSPIHAVVAGVEVIVDNALIAAAVAAAAVADSSSAPDVGVSQASLYWNRRHGHVAHTTSFVLT